MKSKYSVLVLQPNISGTRGEIRTLTPEGTGA